MFTRTSLFEKHSVQRVLLHKLMGHLLLTDCVYICMLSKERAISVHACHYQNEGEFIFALA